MKTQTIVKARTSIMICTFLFVLGTRRMAFDATWSKYEVEDIGLEGRHTFAGFSRETLDLCKENRNVRNRASLHCMLTNA